MRDPDNAIATSEKLSLSQICVFEISNPKRGTWSLTVSGSNGDHEFFVKSSSATNVDFEYYFLIELPGRRRQPVEVPNSNPVIGKSNTFIIINGEGRGGGGVWGGGEGASLWYIYLLVIFSKF